MMKNLSGLYAALATPYTEDDAIDANGLKSLVNFILSHGVDGIYVGGSTGESLLQTPEEREEVLRLVAGECRGKAPVIGHVGALGTKESKRLARVCAEEGYVAVSAIPPVYYPHSKKGIFTYYSEIVGAACGVPLIVYNIPAMSGVKFTLKDLGELLSIRNVIGVKQTVVDMYQMERIHRLFPDTLLLNGYDECFLAGIASGAQGAIGSTFNMMGWRYKKLWALFKEGRNEEALQVQSRCNAIIDVLVEAGVFPGIKFILHRMGIIGSPYCRAPFTAVDPIYHDTFAALADGLIEESRQVS
ncbi:N-acetylneuraminate lyase [Shumkonia mesophila]|uniref:N-acetylneuraminate lyase n=1 Tax=Shumkonia mesophila TaxID=2838854 RepID=UPI002934127F|nr:N-acetylneuraminate lyase [Shumkonia mesophila]